MKNLATSFFFLLLALAGQLASAQTIRRVNNNGITGTNIYADIQTAHDAASAGDIIQVEPSGASYGNLSCSKNVRILGPGYFLNENQPPVLQASTKTATMGNVYFNAGSSGASMSGVTVANAYLGTDNILFQRNRMTGPYIYIGYGAGVANNAVVRQNYAANIYSPGSGGNNVVITNNIVTGFVNMNSSINGEFSNNVVLGTTDIDDFSMRNNYFGGTLRPTANSNYAYNLFADATLPTLGTQSHNTANVAPSAVFVLAPGSTAYDAWYKLKTGTNPATGGGAGGTDIGAYGGSTGYGYRLSGIPAIPTIYQFDQIASGGNLNITISTRSNN